MLFGGNLFDFANAKDRYIAMAMELGHMSFGGVERVGGTFPLG